jgi:hypothetical protein
MCGHYRTPALHLFPTQTPAKTVKITAPAFYLGSLPFIARDENTFRAFPAKVRSGFA